MKSKGMFLGSMALSLSLLVGSASASSTPKHHSKVKGAVVGGVAGHMIAGKKGAAVGAAAGAAHQHHKNVKEGTTKN